MSAMQILVLDAAVAMLLAFLWLLVRLDLRRKAEMEAERLDAAHHRIGHDALWKN